MASLDERTLKSGEISYRVIWWRHGTRQTESGFATKRDALRFKKAVEAAGNGWPDGWVPGRGWARDLGVTNSADTRFLTVAHRWLDTRTRLGSDQRARYRSCINNRSFAAWHDFDIAAIGPDEIAAWILAQQADGAAAKTISNKHGLLFGIFKYAQTRHLIQSNPCSLSELPSRREAWSSTDENGHRVHYFTPEQFELLLASAPADTLELLVVAVGTGLRWGELSALQARDVLSEDDHPSLRVARAWKRVVDSETGRRTLALGPPKTVAGRRNVFVAGPVWEILLRRQQAAVGPESFLFTGPAGRAWNYESFFEQRWTPTRQRAAQAAEKNAVAWPAKTGLHMLRHSYAVWSLSAGVSLEHMQDQMGHESITMTKDTYGGFLPGSRGKAAETIGLAMGKIEGIRRIAQGAA